MAQEVTDHIYLLNKLADLANMKDDLWKYHIDNPKKINVEQEYAKICVEIEALEGTLATLHQ
tara:strand:+ start:82 stop:267 length:186 start_codon:yes stop_codon:yes gene_type:complete